MNTRTGLAPSSLPDHLMSTLMVVTSSLAPAAPASPPSDTSIVLKVHGHFLGSGVNLNMYLILDKVTFKAKYK